MATKRTTAIVVTTDSQNVSFNGQSIKDKLNQMALDISKSVEIIEIMENYIESIRPEPAKRKKIDINYEIIDQSIIINEVRPAWNNPKEILYHGYAKATYVHNKNVWKIYWKRANLKWGSYKPNPTVNLLSDFLKIVDENEHACFKD